MVGLSVVLETTKNLRDSGGVTSPKTPQVVNKATVMITAAAERSGLRRRSCFPETDFLEKCFLCKQMLLSGKDIYMYKGDRAFCSMECRSRQMMDEERVVSKEDCSPVAIKTMPSSSSSSSSSSSPPPGSSGGYGHRRGQRNRAGS